MMIELCMEKRRAKDVCLFVPIEQSTFLIIQFNSIQTNDDDNNIIRQGTKMMMKIHWKAKQSKKKNPIVLHKWWWLLWLFFMTIFVFFLNKIDLIKQKKKIIIRLLLLHSHNHFLSFFWKSLFILSCNWMVTLFLFLIESTGFFFFFWNFNQVLGEREKKKGKARKT